MAVSSTNKKPFRLLSLSLLFLIDDHNSKPNESTIIFLGGVSFTWKTVRQKDNTRGQQMESIWLLKECFIFHVKVPSSSSFHEKRPSCGVGPNVSLKYAVHAFDVL